LRIKEQETRLTFQEHDDDDDNDDDDDDDYSSMHCIAVISACKLKSVKSAELTAIWYSVTVMYCSV
jgi:hypothetical protein